MLQIQEFIPRYTFFMASDLETYVHKIVLEHQPNFHKDPCKDARARVENARTCDALQKFRSTKIGHF